MLIVLWFPFVTIYCLVKLATLIKGERKLQQSMNSKAREWEKKIAKLRKDMMRGSGDAKGIRQNVRIWEYRLHWVSLNLAVQEHLVLLRAGLSFYLCQDFTLNIVG